MPDSGHIAALQVFVNGEAWTMIPTLANAGPEDKVFSLDQDGLLRFGDGVHGKIPPAGSKITASYHFGGGSAGNIGIEVSGNWPLQKSAYLLSLSDGGVLIRHLETAGEQCSGEKRLNYFSGQLLTGSDFDAEQNYFIRKSRRHNRMLHGWGVVSGLEVTVTGGPDSSVVISPGYAIDAEGREILVCAQISLCLPDAPSPQLVALRCAEKETDFIPLPDSDQLKPSRVEECALAWIAAEAPACDALILARLLKKPEGWKVDPTFEPPRCR